MGTVKNFLTRSLVINKIRAIFDHETENFWTESLLEWKGSLHNEKKLYTAYIIEGSCLEYIKYFLKTLNTKQANTQINKRGMELNRELSKEILQMPLKYFYIFSILSHQGSAG